MVEAKGGSTRNSLASANGAARTKLYLLLLMTLGIAMIEFGLLLKPKLVSPIAQGIFGDLIPRFGEAILIASVLGIFVAIREQKELRQQIQNILKAGVGEIQGFVSAAVTAIKSVLVHDIEMHLPASAVIALKQQVLDPIFLREDYEIDLTLSYEGSEKEVLLAKIITTYTVINISPKKDTYHVKLYLDEAVKTASGAPSSKVSKVVIDGRSLKLDETPDGWTIFCDGGLRRFESPLEMPTGRAVPIELHGHQLMEASDLLPWTLVGMCKSLRIRVHKPRDLLLTLLPIHPIRERMRDFIHLESDQLVRAEINEVLLPYQGIEFRWTPRSPRNQENLQKPSYRPRVARKER